MTNRLSRSLKKRWRILNDPEERRLRALIRKFNREQGHGTPTRHADLTPQSVVFDLGGYEGEWTADMRALHDCIVHVFEPHPKFAARLAHKFAQDPKVICHDFALGSRTGELALSDTGDASSAFITDGPQVIGKMRPATEVIPALAVDEIAVAKINIEGGEYDILPHLITTGLIAKFRTLSIQFHDYGTGDRARRDAIRADLEKTHRCVWNYEFVWEQWARRD